MHSRDMSSSHGAYDWRAVFFRFWSDRLPFFYGDHFGEETLGMVTSRRLPRLLNTITANELRIPQPFASKTAKRLNKSTCITIFAFVKSKRFLIQISEQMKRLNVYISPANHSLEQRPKVFNSVSVDVPFNITLRMVDHVVDVFVAKMFVRWQRVSNQFRAFLDLFANLRVKIVAAHSLHNLCHDAGSFVRRIAFKQTKHSGFSKPSVRIPLFVGVHVTGATADKCFVSFNAA